MTQRLLAVLPVFALAILSAGVIGWTGAGVVEHGVRAAALERAADTGLFWLEVEADGAALTLRGAAPNDGAAQRALAALDAVSALSRPIDAMTRRPALSAVRPQTSVDLEILRDANGLTLVGAPPGGASRDAMLEALARRAAVAPTDLTNPVDAPAPAFWAEMTRAAAEAAALLSHGRARISANGVAITGVAQDAEAASALRELARDLRTAGVDARLDLAETETVISTRPEDVAEVAAPPPPATAAPDFVDTSALWVRARVSPTLATLTGVAPDAATRAAVLSYASALFGVDRLHEGLSLADALAPDGWSAAVFAALDAAAALREGDVQVTKGEIRVEGAALQAIAAHQAETALASARAAGWRTMSRIRIDLPARSAATRLPPGRCAEELTSLTRQSPIRFAPSEAAIETVSDDVLDRLAATLTRCGGGAIEIGGHTDSQGSEGYNQRLSQARAEAVRDKLIARGAPPNALTARGYGESRPIADNDTEEGRAANRRIAFSAERAAGNADAAETEDAE